jgi:D-alanyl-D-alanine carboxypeptidase
LSGFKTVLPTGSSNSSNSFNSTGSHNKTKNSTSDQDGADLGSTGFTVVASLSFVSSLMAVPVLCALL